jgi:cysteine desulfuration protein SufE
VVPQEKNPEKLKLHFAVENPQGISAKSFARILDEGLSGLSAQEIASIPDDIVYQVFGRGISMGKGQGLLGMIELVKLFAARQLASSQASGA